jgi:hypothetical protein
VRRDFQTYDAFARASLDQIYPEPQLASAYRVEVNTLASGVLLNDGAGGFDYRPLPGLAQVSPGFGIALTHLNDDPHPDLVLLQNHYTPQRETTRMAAGVGVVMLGDGRGGFEAVWPRESGFRVVGDGKALATRWDPERGLQLLAAQNNDAVLSFAVNHPSASVWAVRLRGGRGNPDAVGARVTLTDASGRRSYAEVYAGAGYLAQSSPVVLFGVGESRPVSVGVRWPDGAVTEHPIDPAAGPYLELARPAPDAAARTGDPPG